MSHRRLGYTLIKVTVERLYRFREKCWLNLVIKREQLKLVEQVFYNQKLRLSMGLKDVKLSKNF